MSILPCSSSCTDGRIDASYTCARTDLPTYVEYVQDINHCLRRHLLVLPEPDLADIRHL